MKNLHIALCLSAFLLAFALFVFLPKSAAQNNVLSDLLSLPAPPPPNPDFVVMAGNSDSRPPEFYDRKNPPSEDAPIDEIMEYWQRQNGYDSTRSFAAKPSAGTVNRILTELEKNPERLGNYLNLFSGNPGAAQRIKNIFQTRKSNADPEDYLGNNVEAWLAFNTDYKIEQLAQVAANAKDTDQYVTNQDEVLALARVDFERARPLLERMVGDSTQPVSQTLARWALLEHAVREGNSIEADRYRDDLKKTVENKNGKPGDRDLAMDALVRTGDFPGRDDWYFSLLDDETLHDLRVNGQSYTGLTTLLNLSDPEKYVEKMIEFVRTGSPNQRSAAIRNLTTVINESNPEVIRALLPWLENPAWAKDINNSRRLIVGALATIEMPESVPGLIALLDEKVTIKRSADKMDSIGRNSNISNANIALGDEDFEPDDYDSEEVYPYRSQAITALAKQKNIQAVPALRRVLPEVANWQRDTVVRAILESGGYSVNEQVAALESVAENVKDNFMDGNKMVDYYEGEAMTDNDSPPPPMPTYRGSGRATGITMATNMSMTNTKMTAEKEVFNPADIIPILGVQVAGLSEPSAELVTAVVSRISRVENTNPSLANALRKIIENWNGPAINALMLTDLGNGKADVDAVVKLLSLRKELREKQSDDIFAARSSGNATALGITSCILENTGEYLQILQSDNPELKIAFLGCARLIRAKLPVQTVGVYLKDSNKMLANAAELYLESEDSPEARNFIYALYPNKAKILGATAFFAPDKIKLPNQNFLSALFTSVNEKSSLPAYMLYNILAEQGNMQVAERKLQREITESTDILGIYAYNENFVRIYADRAVFSWSENDARYRERTLNAQEFDYLKNYLAANNVGELPPFIGNCSGCQARELLMLGANGGRRVYVKSETMPQFFDGLDKIFEQMRTPPAKLKYYLEKNVAGLEILYSDDKLPALTAWKNAGQISLLLEDAERRKQINEELLLADKAAYENSGDENFDYSKAESESEKRRKLRALDEFSWRTLRDGQPGDFVGQPPGFEAIPRKDNLPIQSDSEQWKRRAGNIEVRRDGEGIYRINGSQAVKLQEGFYHSYILTPDGRWIIAAKFNYSTDRQLLVRIDPQNGRETPLKMPENMGLTRPVAFIPSLKKVLISVGSFYDYEEEAVRTGGTFFLLDADSGAITPVKSEVRPLAQQSFRPLQTNGKPDEFWAAIPGDGKEFTEVGVYNSKTLTFKPMLKIPRISFNSMDLWVDEPGNKIYFVYQGQLLALPLRKSE